MEIKRGTTPIISVRFKGLDEDEEIVSAQFVFKQICSEDAPVLLRKCWPGEAVRGENGLFKLPFSEKETRLFEAGRYVYLDARLCLDGGGVAAAPVAALMVRPTLFAEE